ncbi:hypothetical protein ACUW9M_005038 [Serratia sp. 121840015-2]
MTVLTRRNLRPLFLSLDLTSVVHDSPWAEALSWLRMVFSKKQTLSQRSLTECPPGTLPERLRPYLLELGEDGEPTGLNAGRYEFWLYRQIRKRFQAGEFHLNDSLRHRHLSDELTRKEANKRAQYFYSDDFFTSFKNYSIFAGKEYNAANTSLKWRKAMSEETSGAYMDGYEGRN